MKRIGIDLTEVKRFTLFKDRADRFLTNNFTKSELDYCFSFKQAAQRLAGTFAAKEAVFKALTRKNVLFSSIEIRRNSRGQPTVWFKNRLQKSISISITYTARLAAAAAIFRK